jgi:dihydroorotate dehydrogenase electron transfer subunit
MSNLMYVRSRVVSNIQLFKELPHIDRKNEKETRLIRLNCPEIAAKVHPGQFVMVRCGSDSTLPRPFSIFRVSGGDLDIFYTVWERGKGTEWLAERHTSDEVGVFGPLGNGYTLNQPSRNILLIAGGMGIASLYFLAQEGISRICNVTLLYGTSKRNNRYPIPPEIKQIPATEDGTVGYKGMITDLIPQYIGKSDQIFICGPLPMYLDIVKRKNELKLEGKPVQISLEVKMGCGTGVCYGCTIKTNSGLKQVCRDGPVFNLDDIMWNSISL